MASIAAINDSLRSIIAKSSVRFADLAAGTPDGVVIRFRWTAPTISSSFPFQKDDVDPADGSCPLVEDRRYLVASLTKPVVSLVGVQLAAEGRLSLNEPVREFVEGFHRGQLRGITLRHLLTHTSGLPDMLPNNCELRAAHAPLSEFVRHTADVTPDFLPGTGCRYSSMGIAVLAQIMEHVTGVPVKQLVADRLFRPLNMSSSWLGLPEQQADQLLPTIVPCELPATQSADSDWNWNSRYWRCLGAPWGGMLSTVEDLGQLSMMILNQGRDSVGASVLPSAVLTASTKNQTCSMSGLPDVDRYHRPWGLGWRMNWPDHATSFSDFLPVQAFGHWGATGTVMWIDPESRRWCVILTNQPYELSQSVIQRMSNLIASADRFVFCPY